MPTPTVITDLDPVAANNFPAGSDAPSTLDDTLRAHGAFIRQQLDATQTQLYTAFTTGGTTTAYTLTPAPALTALAAGQRFRVKFNATNTSTTPTLAISGLTAKNLKVYSSAGAKADPAVGAFAANMLSDVEYDGTDMVVLDQLPIAAASASETVPGVSELATAAEFNTGTDTGRVITVKVARDNNVVLGTPVAATSGTSIDFTGIPAWAKKIAINFAAVSTNGTSAIAVQLGDSGGVETSGYAGTAIEVIGATATNLTSSFRFGSVNAANVLHGTVFLTLESAATNTWVCSAQIALSNGGQIYICAGSKPLSAALDRVRVTTEGGVNTFDAGEINITYQ